ncbi:hypothetical protein [Alkalilimnicola sp. S0819]|uniref:hypothetical protein n=1 Tax=Alkalilimnicola sp. S0819 TaxID=2613922 RepID=UPI001261567F|nr:hypothetical protein [Alkalilimnicola sp. S0819]KAB7627794.1 hypothetical protein F3N43_02120 [Alkalilimnicola sp. S0819]MPQ15424.1 hypothetical protein [Alkalilimnicola sp. S0819]
MFGQSFPVAGPAWIGFLALVALSAGESAGAEALRSGEPQVELIGVSPLDQGTNPFDQADLRRDINHGDRSSGGYPRGGGAMPRLTFNGVLPTPAAYPSDALISIDIDPAAKTLTVRLRVAEESGSALLLEPRAALDGRVWVSAAADWMLLAGPSGPVATGVREWVLQSAGGERFTINATFSLNAGGGLTVTAIRGVDCTAGGCP